MRRLIQKFFMWIWRKETIPLGPLAPYVLGLALGRMPHRVKEKNEKD